MNAKLERIIAVPEKAMQSIVNHVVMGGSVLEICRTWGVSYAEVMQWIKADKTRNQQYISALDDRTEWIKETLLMELKRISSSDLREIIAEDGSIKPAHEWPDSIASVIQSIETVEEFEGSGRDKTHVGWNKKIKLWNKEKAIELFGKHLSMFVDRHEHTVKTSLEDLIGASMKLTPEDFEKSE